MTTRENSVTASDAIERAASNPSARLVNGDASTAREKQVQFCARGDRQGLSQPDR
jgi:hypothetical protein